MPKPDSLSVPQTPALQPASASRRRSASAAQQIAQFAVVASLAVLCYFVISRFFVQSVTVVGVSMVPTLADSEHYLLNRWIFYLREPRRNDVVVLRDPMDHGCSVKRVIGVDGDTIYLKGGDLYLNGRKLKESYLRPGTPTYANPNCKEQFFRCGRQQYFVLGDNRKNSVDSRAYGPISRQAILGLVIR